MSGFIEFLHHYDNGVHHRSFRLTNENSPRAHEPHHLVLIAASILAIILNAQILYFYSTPSLQAVSPSRSAVLGEAVHTGSGEATSSLPNTSPGLEAYQQNIKLIVTAYLTNRATYFDGFVGDELPSPAYLEDWQRSIEDAQEALLSMRVSSRFQELHIRLATAFAVEDAMVRDLREESRIIDDQIVEELTHRFWMILQDYPWLSS